MEATADGFKKIIMAGRVESGWMDGSWKMDGGIEKMDELMTFRSVWMDGCPRTFPIWMNG